MVLFENPMLSLTKLGATGPITTQKLPM